MRYLKQPYLKRLNRQDGFLMPTLIALMVVISLIGLAAMLSSVNSNKLSRLWLYVQQAQLASASGMDYAKEQYELDINYMGTPETDFINSGNVRVTYEVEHIEFTNDVNTQQQIRSVGRVYVNDDPEPIAERDIIGKITRLAGSNSSVRFIFVIDNSGSMSVSEWNDSKTTVDIAIEYVLDNVSNAEVAVVQYGTNHYTHEHKYDVTVPFTTDKDTATNWDRRYGPGSASPNDYQDHLAASLARMRDEGVYGPGEQLDLVDATSVQYVIFTDAFGMDFSGCCSALKHYTSSTFDTTNNGAFTTMDQHGEFNVLKDGSVYADHGYSDLSSQFTILNINQDTARETIETSAAIASPGGEWEGDVDENPGDPEGEGIILRRFISTTLLTTDPNDILEIIDEIIEAELNI